MPALQVRDLPQNLYDDLQQRAVREHRSMAQQTIVALEEHLQRGRQGEYQGAGTGDAFAQPGGVPAWSDGDARERQARAERKRELLERIRERAASADEPPVEAATVVQLVRDMRDERADGLTRASGRRGSREGEPR
jgi:hypothetical protein